MLQRRSAAVLVIMGSLNTSYGPVRWFCHYLRSV